MTKLVEAIRMLALFMVSFSMGRLAYTAVMRPDNGREILYLSITTIIVGVITMACVPLVNRK